jgi:hypothetical protein
MKEEHTIRVIGPLKHLSQKLNGEVSFGAINWEMMSNPKLKAILGSCCSSMLQTKEQSEVGC